ncbi:unnamed protein product [Soboliphyme baturini]|uniref:Secreted protein n=1 Tax=Soboliphyme baturini TaxID=241478 RepID=A0A183IV95_9BILA|nr:unnamed protein product [Soboliphyme baturini]
MRASMLSVLRVCLPGGRAVSICSSDGDGSGQLMESCQCIIDLLVYYYNVTVRRRVSVIGTCFRGQSRNGHICFLCALPRLSTHFRRRRHEDNCFGPARWSSDTNSSGRRPAPTICCLTLRLKPPSFEPWSFPHLVPNDLPTLKRMVDIKPVTIHVIR